MRNLAISNDGKRTVTTSTQGKTVELWDTVTGQELRSFPMKRKFDIEYFGAVAISGNGRFVAASHGHSGSEAVDVWDAETGQEKATLRHSFGATSLAISDDGKYVLTGYNGRPGRLWDLTAGPEKFVLQEGRSAPIAQLAVDHNGDRFISAGRERQAITFFWDVWDAKTGKKKLTIERPTFSGGFAIDPAGQRLYLADLPDSALRVWDLDTGMEQYPLAGDKGYVIHSVALGGDGRRLFTGGNDGMVRAWDLVNRRQDMAFAGAKGGESVGLLALSRDGKILALAGAKDPLDGNPMVKGLDADTGRERFAIAAAKNELFSVALNTDSPFLVSWNRSKPDHPLKVLELPGGRLKVVLEAYYVLSVAVTPDGQRIVTASGDGTGNGIVRLWDAATGQEMLAWPSKSSSTSVAVSGDGRRIVAGGGDGTITVWEAP
jgi:WD40 repeat protein